jgi:hypothetical protein
MKRILAFAALGLSLCAAASAMADSPLGDPRALVTQHVWAVESHSSKPYVSSLYETPDQSKSVAQAPADQGKSAAQSPSATQ